MQENDIVIIADTQITPHSSLKHIEKLAKYIWKVKPKYVIHIGDNFDFESLSFYASPLESEGRRLVDDLESGRKGLAIIPEYIDKMNKKAKKKKYKPEYHFMMGNHCDRLDRMVKSNPHLEGLVDLRQLVKDQGWEYHEFLHPFWVDDIMFNHYLPNPLSGRPIGGSVDNKLNKHPHSFVQGHIQQYQYGRRQTMDGRPQFGIVAGSFYFEDESYRRSSNTEVRGFTHLVSFTNRYKFKDYDCNFVSLERLMEMSI